MARKLAIAGIMAGVASFFAGCGLSFNSDAQPSSDATASRSASGTAEARRLANQADESAAASAPGSTTYRMGTQDVVEIVVFKVPDLTRTVQIGDSGTVNLPLLGEIPAAGRTAQEFERDLTRRLGVKYLNNPQINVYIKEFNSQRVTIEGAVKVPGVFPLRGRMTLMQAIAMAQGLDRDVASSTVTVFRTVNGQRNGQQIDVDAVTSGEAPDPQIQSGDVIVVPTSGAKVAFQNFLKLGPVAGTLKPY